MAISISGTLKQFSGTRLKNILPPAADANLTISNASYSGNFLSVGTESGGPLGLTFNSEGTKMFIASGGEDAITQYTLGNGFDITTASFDSVTFSVLSQDNTPASVFFNSDGTKMFVGGNSTSTIYQYSLTSGYDLTTASYDSISFGVGTESSGIRQIFFNPSGTKMFVIGSDNAVYQYSLSSGFDLTTASYTGTSFDASAQVSSSRGVAFNSTGTRMFVIDFSTDAVYQYSLAIGFDVSTASYDSISFDISGQFGSPQTLWFNPDATKMYITDSAGNNVYEYNL